MRITQDICRIAYYFCFMMKKTFLTPIHKELPELKIIRKRIPLNENEDIRFEMQMDLKTMQNTFKTLCANLPIYKGNLIISGCTANNKKITLDVVRSTNGLQNDFMANKNSQTRWAWCFTQLTENNFKSLYFQLAKELN